jgi:hypothetical protein
MIAMASIIAFFLIIALLRFGVTAEYGQNGIKATAHVALWKIDIFPREEKPGKEERKAARKARKKQKALARAGKRAKKRPEEEKPGTLESLTEMLPGIRKGLGRLRRRLLIKKLDIRFVAAGGDPYKTAMAFGAANAAYGALLPMIDNSFRVKNRELSASADFDAATHSIYVKAAISVAVWEAIYITASIIPALLRNTSKTKTDKKTARPDANIGKDVQAYGKATD